jgi:hypothetical protein
MTAKAGEEVQNLETRRLELWATLEELLSPSE